MFPINSKGETDKVRDIKFSSTFPTNLRLTGWKRRKQRELDTIISRPSKIISFRIGEKRFRIGGPYEISSWMMDARWCERADIGYACLARLTRSAGSITGNQVYVSWYAYFQTVTYDLDAMQPSSLPLASLPFPSRAPSYVSRLQLASLHLYLINVFLSSTFLFHISLLSCSV